MFGRIIGTGSCLPSKRVTNQDLAGRIDTSDAWIRERTGIESRYVLNEKKGETTSELASIAGKRAMEEAGIAAEEIDLILLSTVSSEVVLPNTACLVQKQLGAVNATCLDVNSACTGFLAVYNIAQSFLHAGIGKTALIIGAEGLSKIVNWEDRGTCILFGDGAGAAVLQADEGAVFHTRMKADGSKGGVLTKQNVDTSYVEMDGRAVFEFAVRQVPLLIQELMKDMGVEEKDIDCFLLHQANKRILESVTKRLKTTEQKVPINVMEYGNTSSASVAILLDELRKKGELKTGDKVIMAGFGAGLTWGASYLEL